MNKKATMHALRLSIIVVLAGAACQAEDPFTVQLQGEFISYATTDAIEVCEGNVLYAQRWMHAVAAQLGIPPEQILPVNYHLVDFSEIGDYCESNSACTKTGDGQVQIYAYDIIEQHELVHAIHLSAWPRQRALLQEGLAVVYDDHGQAPLFWNPISSEHLDELLEFRTRGDVPDEIYFVGPYIVYWILERHGAAALEAFWRADAASESGSAADFRATFEQHFGESLDAMIAEVEPLGAACIIPTCADDLIDWQGDRWTFESPQACGGTVLGRIEGDEVQLEQTVLVEIGAAGLYQIAVSEGAPSQGVSFAPCSAWCGGDDWFSVSAGEVREFELQPGRYRVHTFKGDANDPGVSVEIQLAG